VGRIAADTMAGDLVLTLGAGDVYQLGESVLQNLGYATKIHEPH
jgi:UDP-N-acetylmuramate-alanine ligase